MPAIIQNAHHSWMTTRTLHYRVGLIICPCIVINAFIRCWYFAPSQFFAFNLLNLLGILLKLIFERSIDRTVLLVYILNWVLGSLLVLILPIEILSPAFL